MDAALWCAELEALPAVPHQGWNGPDLAEVSPGRTC
jgi:hypothetical protein